MRPLSPLIAACLLVSVPGFSQAQLIFQESLGEYEQPKKKWERWSKTKVGDYIAYRIVGKDNVVLRFELIEKGDHTMLIRSTRPNPFGGNKPPVVREHRHSFVEGAFEPKRGEFSEQTLQFQGEEVPAVREDFFNPVNKQIIKQVWSIEAAPFDGVVMYEQFLGGKLNMAYIAEFGSSADSPLPNEAEVPPPLEQKAGMPDLPEEPMPEEPESPEEPLRKWTSRDGQFSIMASMVKYEKGFVHLKPEGKDQVVPVALLKLSREDQQYVRQLEKQREDKE